MSRIPLLAFRPPADPQAALAHGRACLLLSALLFGAMAVAARSAAQALPAAEVAFVRFCIGVACVVVTAPLQPEALRPTRYGLLVLRGAFGGTAVLAYFLAMEKLGAGLSTLLNNTYPLWGALIAAVFLGERLTARTLAGLLVATLGMFAVVGPDETLNAVRGLGETGAAWALLAGLASGLAGGFATTIIRKLRQTESALTVFAAFSVGGALVCVGPALRQWRPIGAREAAILGLVGLLSFAAQLVFTYALKFVPTSGSVVNLLTVVATYSFAWAFLGEPIAGHALAGGAIVMGGVWLASTGDGRRPAPAAAPPIVDVQS